MVESVGEGGVGESALSLSESESSRAPLLLGSFASKPDLRLDLSDGTGELLRVTEIRL